MITPEWLDKRLNMLSVHKALQESILRDIVRRMMKTDFAVTDTAAWQAEKLQQSGMLYDDIIAEVSRQTKKTAAEVRAAFDAAETEVFNYDNEALEGAGIDPKMFRNISPAMKGILTAAGRKTFTAAKNITKTTAVTSQSMFINACDVAHMQISSGAFSYQEALRQAVKSAAVQGFTVMYPTGRRTSLDAAVRRAVLTGVNQTCGKLQEMRADEYEVDLMEITAHFCARPTHAEWQGQVVSRSGRSGYLTLDEIGYGAVDGFMGANCRHNWHMYFEGLSHRAYTPEQLENLKNETVTYNDEQMPVWQARERQRAMERSVRRYKQELVAYDEAMKNVTEPEEKMQWQADFNAAAVKLKSKEAQIKDFCKQTGIAREMTREQVFAAATENGIKNFGKSVSGKAVEANIKVLTSREYYDKVKAGTQILTIEEGSQGKHILGHNNYTQGKSYIFGGISDAQSLVNQYAGKGKFFRTRTGLYTNKEIINANTLIGVNVNNRTGALEWTNKFYIHYSKKGTHIVPTLKRGQ